MNRLAAPPRARTSSSTRTTRSTGTRGGRGVRAGTDDGGRPLLLVSVGYSSCHWCHVMEHETFDDQAIAATSLNEHFVNVKVDREERPDIDALTMQARAMTGQGAGRPPDAGRETVPPPDPRHGLPSFRQVLQAIAGAWDDRRDDLEARPSGSCPRSAAQRGSRRVTGLALTSRSSRRPSRPRPRRQPAFGGFEHRAEVPARLLRSRRRRGARDGRRRTLDGWPPAVYDVVGGGFHRYSVDARVVPHFEKML